MLQMDEVILYQPIRLKCLIRLKITKQLHIDSHSNSSITIQLYTNVDYNLGHCHLRKCHLHHCLHLSFVTFVFHDLNFYCSSFRGLALLFSTWMSPLSSSVSVELFSSSVDSSEDSCFFILSLGLFRKCCDVVPCILIQATITQNSIITILKTSATTTGRI